MVNVISGVMVTMMKNWPHTERRHSEHESYGRLAIVHWTAGHGYDDDSARRDFRRQAHQFSIQRAALNLFGIVLCAVALCVVVPFCVASMTIGAAIDGTFAIVSWWGERRRRHQRRQKTMRRKQPMMQIK